VVHPAFAAADVGARRDEQLRTQPMIIKLQRPQHSTDRSLTLAERNIVSAPSVVVRMRGNQMTPHPHPFDRHKALAEEGEMALRKIAMRLAGATVAADVISSGGDVVGFEVEQWDVSISIDVSGPTITMKVRR
jgi:hypothetical protein